MMDNVCDTVHSLRAQIAAIEDVLQGLYEQLKRAEQHGMAFLVLSPGHLGCFLSAGAVSEDATLDAMKRAPIAVAACYSVSTFISSKAKYETGMRRYGQIQYDQTPLLDAEEYKRYGRQMILPEVGLDGQLRLKYSSALIVGVGGLGCPAAAYLAGAGVGTLGLVDGDTVELSNLHRQILHSTETIKTLKVESARNRLRRINPKVHYATHDFHLTPSVAVDLFKQYDVILDCTDHPTSRYLISDAAVLASRRLVSASALKTEGQLMLLNNPPSLHSTSSSTGHCYRCVFPRPPPAESVITCGEGGILGPVVGVMGVLMAVEALKLLLEPPKNPKRISERPPLKPAMLLYSAFNDQPFRTIRLGGRRKDCPSCSSKPTITEDALRSGALDYAAFCGVRSPPDLIHTNQRISPTDYNNLRNAPAKPHLLIDVREKTHFDLAHLTGSINIPLYDIQNQPLESIEKIHNLGLTLSVGTHEAPLYFICRFGNDSQLAVHHLCEKFKGLHARDVRGGLDAWRREVDPGFPEY